MKARDDLRRIKNSDFRKIACLDVVKVVFKTQSYNGISFAFDFVSINKHCLFNFNYVRIIKSDTTPINRIFQCALNFQVEFLPRVCIYAGQSITYFKPK